MPRHHRKKKLFEREQDRTPVSSPEVLEKKHRAFVPQSSPPRRLTRASHRQKPTCLVFGPLREAVYNDFFFCHNCKMYEDTLNSGLHKNVDRNSRRCRCTAKHENYFFPTDRLLIQKVYQRKDVAAPGGNNKDNSSSSEETAADVVAHDETQAGYNITFRGSEAVLAEEECANLREAFDTLGEAYYGMEIQFREKLSHISWMYERELKLSAQYRKDIDELKCLLDRQKDSVTSLQKRVHSLVNSVEYYKQKLTELQVHQRQHFLPLEEALVSSVNVLLTSKQRYKLMSTENISESIAKAVFNNNFVIGVALNSIITHAKGWLRIFFLLQSKS
jgi:hypothetical protein